VISSVAPSAQLNAATCFGLCVHIQATLLCHAILRGGADKSLARPTSWYRTELILSLERAVCSCAELQVLYGYRGWKEAWQATRAISTTSRRELSSSLFSFLSARQGAEGNSRHSDRNIRGTCTIVCHRQKLGVCIIYIYIYNIIISIFLAWEVTNLQTCCL